MGVTGAGIKAFADVFREEIKAINQRRKHHGRPDLELETEATRRYDTEVLRPTRNSNLVGLSLSGGGIRSAAFSLGVLQALDERELIGKIDYLSSVSGGGYIGLSMTAAMSESAKEQFPFASKLQAVEEPGVQHIRDHSNYLFPQGAINIFSNIVVYLRGIVANIVLLLPWLLLSAALTVWWFPNSAALTSGGASGFGGDFRYTLFGLLAFIAILALWALWRSTPMGRTFSDVPARRASTRALKAAVSAPVKHKRIAHEFLARQHFAQNDIVIAAFMDGRDPTTEWSGSTP